MQVHPLIRNPIETGYLARQWIAAHQGRGQRFRPSWRHFYRIIVAYSETHRKHHAVSHLVYGLRFFDEHFGSEWDAWLAKLVWFHHDLIYDPANPHGTNEALSAALFLEYGAKIGLPPSELSRGQAIIIATANHQTANPSDLLWPAVSDTDLSILAAPQHVYLRYARNVWSEYRFHGAATYLAGRLAFLEETLKRPIFRSLPLLEDQARSNLKFEHKLLKTRPSLILI